jgi:hypothetical protein
MCPACVGGAALMISGAISTGGLTALAARLLHSKNSSERVWSSKTNKEK